MADMAEWQGCHQIDSHGDKTGAKRLASRAFRDFRRAAGVGKNWQGLLAGVSWAR